MHRSQAGIHSPGRVREQRLPACLASIVVIAALSALDFTASAQPLISDDDQRAREAAINEARQENYETAPDVLSRLHNRYPENAALLQDYIVVLAWAGMDEQAFSLASSLDPASLPAFVALPVAKTARNLRRFDDAVAWYQAVIRNEPANEQALLGLMLTHADRGDATGVNDVIRALSELGIDDSQATLATAYSLRSTGDSFQALELYDAALKVEPTNREALRGKALVLRSMLLPTQALAIARANPGVLTTAEIARLRSDEAAIRVRLAARTNQLAPSAFAATDAAISYLDETLDSAADPSAGLALKRDRIVASADAMRAEEAVAVFESLSASERNSQAYVLAAVAQAYLQLHRPEDALSAIQAAIDLDPMNVEYSFTLAYVYVDLERFDDAFELTASLTRNLPVVNSAAGGTIVKVNSSGMRAEILTGVVDAYGDQLANAQRRFESILADAPNNADARHELANVYRWRGWLDRSLYEYQQVLTNDPALLSARLGQAHAWIDAREYAAVETFVSELQANFSREPAARSLIDRWNVHNKSELLVTGSTIRSSGSTFGSRAHEIDARWYTAPLGYRHRAFVHAYEGKASFPEGDADRRRLGAGVQYLANRWTAAGEISAGSGGDGAGLAGSVDWRVSDRWMLGGTLGFNSYDTQLRAHRADIEGDSLGMSATLTIDESVGATFGLSVLDYSDGNAQTTAFGEGHYRVLNRPRSKIDVIGSVSETRSETDLVPYFSPRQAATALAGLEHQFRLYRRYSRSLAQRIRFTTGRYEQESVPGGSIWRFAYELDWQLSDVLSVSAGIERRSDYYDALREHSTYGLMSLNARF